MKRLLITGGAGFIGHALVRQLKDRAELVVLDSLSPQIHGDEPETSGLLAAIRPHCTFIRGDVRKEADVLRALAGVDTVIHLAAETGTGQSMYALCDYADTNIMGTATLLQVMLKHRLPVRQLILASSRAVYGEGQYRCPEHGTVYPSSRSADAMKQGDFSLYCPFCSQVVTPEQTSERSPLHPVSYYAFTKLAQEQMLAVTAPTLGLAYTVFRYQNVYGAGQSLSNPYTGILSIFSRLMLAGQAVNVFEDGEESRDFIHVSDVAAATAAAIGCDAAHGCTINLGSGVMTSVLEMAHRLKEKYRSRSEIRISGDFRLGDIRHNAADISLAQELLHFAPRVSLDAGLDEFTDWVQRQNLQASDDRFTASLQEMSDAGMLHQAGD